MDGDSIEDIMRNYRNIDGESSQSKSYAAMCENKLE